MMSIQKNQVVSSLLVVLLSSTSIAQASNLESTKTTVTTVETVQKARTPITVSINIKARPELVWLSIHEDRTQDPELLTSTVLEEHGNSSTLEQTFAIPLLGNATCIMSFIESPPGRIDYTLITSDKFKTFDGSWVLAPSRDRHSTRLALTCDTDLGVPVPPFLLKMIASKKIGKRLAFVKSLAEKKELQLSVISRNLK